MSSEHKAATTHGPIRRILKLLVTADAAPSLFGRIRAGLILIGLLAGFAALGYGVPVLIAAHIK